jgi:hypothetical protein
MKIERRTASMSKTKYGKHVIREPFIKATKDFNGAMIFAHGEEDKSGEIYEYHCINRPGWSIKDSRVHDTWEVLCFVGGNPENIMDLGAEVSICLGDDKEEHVFNIATVVSIPPGLKHGPITVKKFTKPFVLLRILTTNEYEKKRTPQALKADPFEIKSMQEGAPVTKNGKKYWMNVFQGPFYVQYEPGWTGTSIWSHHNEYKNGLTLGYHCIKTTYDVPMTHSHNFHELLCFIGGDPENPKDLGAEVSMCLGDEAEKHTFNTATIISMPPGLKHCPLLVKNITKPVVFLEVSTTAGFAAVNDEEKKPAKKATAKAPKSKKK